LAEMGSDPGCLDIGYPLALKGIVEKFLEVNPIKVVESVIIWLDGPPLRAKNLFRVRL
jgi:hypothetical protein